MPDAEPNLSKSQFMMGQRCALSMWFRHHGMHKNVTAHIDGQIKTKRAAGTEIGILAQSWFAGGKEVKGHFGNAKNAVKETRQLIDAGEAVIFEAAAIHPVDGSNARIDALVKVPGTDQWDMVEVKSSTKVKDSHIDDLAFQYHVFKGAGYDIRSAGVLYVNNRYVRKGAIDPKALFTLEDVTAKVKLKQDEIEAAIKNLSLVAEAKDEPSAELGSRCTKPANCDYKPHCWKDVPLYSVFNVYAYARDGDATIKKVGSHDINDIPVELLPKDVRAVEIEAHKAGTIQSNPQELKNFASRVEYPVYYLDYETVQSPVPLYDGTRPYRQVPFQFSLHVQDQPGGSLKHTGFLHKESTDPRGEFAKALVAACGTKGSVIVYNMDFESQRNNELAADLPAYKTQLQEINARMIDQYVPFRNRWLYSPDQNGSASIKAVLPSFTGMTYKNLEISNGEQALNEYLSFVTGGKTEEEAQKLWADLEVYCGQDTMAMVELQKVIKDYANRLPAILPQPAPAP